MPNPSCTESCYHLSFLSQISCCFQQVQHNFSTLFAVVAAASWSCYLKLYALPLTDTSAFGSDQRAIFGLAFPLDSAVFLCRLSAFAASRRTHGLTGAFSRVQFCYPDGFLSASSRRFRRAQHIFSIALLRAAMTGPLGAVISGSMRCGWLNASAFTSDQHAVFGLGFQIFSPLLCHAYLHFAWHRQHSTE